MGAKRLDDLVNSVKDKAKSATKELFDVCFESVESRSNDFTTDLIKNEKEVIDQIDEKAQRIIRNVFSRLEFTSDFIMARVLSFLTTLTFIYIAFQLNEGFKNGRIDVLRITLSLFLLTVILASSIRVFRFLFDWHGALREYQRWQFLTCVITGCLIIATFTTKWVLEFI